MTNSQNALALEILKAILAGNNTGIGLDQVFIKHPDYTTTLSKMQKYDPDTDEFAGTGMLKVHWSDMGTTYSIIGTMSIEWSLDVLRWLNQNKFISPLLCSSQDPKFYSVSECFIKIRTCSI